MDRRVFVAGEDGGIPPIPRLLFAFLGAPALWAVHLSLSYFLVTLDCITAWDGAVWAVIAATVACGAGSVTAGWTGWRAWSRLDRDGAGTDARDWSRFVLLAGMAASALFTLVIVAQGVAPLFLSTCVR